MNRSRDIALLCALLVEPARLRDGEPEAFGNMLDRLDRAVDAGNDELELTGHQRRWVEDAAHRLEIDDPEDDPRERNKGVPRGRDVPVPEVLRRLPKAPPGRKLPT